MEIDGEGDAPPEHRAAFLAASGTWAVEIDEPNAVLAIKAVKDILGLPLKNAAALKLSLPTVYVGTRAEAEWLVLNLEQAGLRARATKSA